MFSNFKYEEIDGYDVCCQCKDIISNPRCVTFGGTFDRKQFDFKKLQNPIDVMFIGQNPWFNEKKDKTNVYERAFGDKSEKILIEYISESQLDTSRIWITNVVQCSVEGNVPYLVPEAFKNCKLLLNEEISNIKPKIIASLGKIASDLVNQLLLEFQLKYRHMKMLHPNALSYNSSLREKYHEQFQQLKKML